jgi:hypothetical protein
MSQDVTELYYHPSRPGDFLNRADCGRFMYRKLRFQWALQPVKYCDLDGRVMRNIQCA